MTHLDPAYQLRASPRDLPRARRYRRAGLTQATRKIRAGTRTGRTDCAFRRSRSGWSPGLPCGTAR